MRFSTYNFGEEDGKENAGPSEQPGPSNLPNPSKLPSPSNLLILLVDSNDPNTEDPFDVLFEESVTLAAQGANIHWFRPRAARQIPPSAKNLVLRPDYLSRIRFHYSYEGMFESIQRFLIKPLYVNFSACTTLIVELQDASVYLSKVECATLLALLANTGNWLAKHRSKNRQLPAEAFQKKTFPVILLLRDFAEYRLLVSMYTRNGLVWRNRQNWEDIFRWDLPIMHKGKTLKIGIEKVKIKK